MKFVIAPILQAVTYKGNFLEMLNSVELLDVDTLSRLLNVFLSHPEKDKLLHNIHSIDFASGLATRY